MGSLVQCSPGLPSKNRAHARLSLGRTSLAQPLAGFRSLPVVSKETYPPLKDAHIRCTTRGLKVTAELDGRHVNGLMLEQREVSASKGEATVGGAIGGYGCFTNSGALLIFPKISRLTPVSQGRCKVWFFNPSREASDSIRRYPCCQALLSEGTCRSPAFWADDGTPPPEEDGGGALMVHCGRSKPKTDAKELGPT